MIDLGTSQVQIFADTAAARGAGESATRGRTQLPRKSLARLAGQRKTRYKRGEAYGYAKVLSLQ